MKNQHKKKQHHRNKYYKYLAWVLGIILAFIFILSLSFRFSPWPGALVIRHVFDQNSRETRANLEKAIPAQDVTMLADQAYGKEVKSKLDVYIPNNLSTDQTLPAVIWTHGGAWLSGDKQNAAPYFELLASKGFVVVSLNYTLAPNATYPEPVKQLNQAHSYLLENAERFHLDTTQLFLAGDSAGAQLSSQLATLITNPEYAQELGITPALTPAQLKAAILYCGIYKMEGLVHPDDTLPKLISWGDDTAVWAYTGSRNRSDPAIGQMSAYYHVTAQYPDVFISGGNGDPLTSAQSIPFADKLKTLGVDVTSLFYAADHAPSLPHEYQFTWNEDGQKAFDQMVHFLKQKAQ